MRHLFFLSITSLLTIGTLGAKEALESLTPELASPTSPVKETQTASFQPFTGSISGSRVRLRLLPTLDSVVLKEFSHHDLIQVIGETDGFYAVLPEAGTKGYVFRTYVLDGVIEGSNVNVRLKPDTTSAVIIQLQQGEKIIGKPSKENPKWLEIELPASVRFYVAKEFVVREGALSLYDQWTTEKKELITKLQALETEIRTEFAKPFSEIDPSHIKKELESILDQVKNSMPEVARKATALLRKIEQEYLHLRVLQNESVQPPAEQLLASPPEPDKPHEEPAKEPFVSFYLKEQEQKLIQNKIDKEEVSSAEEFYAREQQVPTLLKGNIIPFERTLRVKPGDFVLVDPVSKVPIAYLYSTKVNLESLVGNLVSIQAQERPNHDFALPAYFVYVATPIEK